MKDETYKFRVTSTAQHNKLFATRKEAEKYVKQQKKDMPLVEFRIFEVVED